MVVGFYPCDGHPLRNQRNQTSVNLVAKLSLENAIAPHSENIILIIKTTIFLAIFRGPLMCKIRIRIQYL